MLAGMPRQKYPKQLQGNAPWPAVSSPVNPIQVALSRLFFVPTHHSNRSDAILLFVVFLPRMIKGVDDRAELQKLRN